MRINSQIALFCAVIFALLVSVCGCGAFGSRGGPVNTNLPASFSRDEFRPNYGGDLKSVSYFVEPVITYRIVDGNASDIQRNSIGSVVPTTVQYGDITGAFAKLQAELAKNEPGGHRTFVQVEASDSKANIDVVIQTSEQFQDTEDLTARGATNTYVRETPPGTLGRSVIRIRNDLPEREFRSTAMHEGLHAVGLAGHSRRLGVILQPDQYPILPELKYTTYDSNTLRANYAR